VKGRPKVFLAKRSQTIDLEYTMFRIEEGKTYFDDGTTVFDVYIDAGLKDRAFEEAPRRPDTIIVTHPHGNR
jgi:phosphoribosyl 1,2-cyclic phosphodiesterase